MLAIPNSVLAISNSVLAIGNQAKTLPSVGSVVFGAYDAALRMAILIDLPPHAQ